MRKNTKTTLVKNHKMDSEVYKLRRKVIDIIYELKKEIDLPRIDVRIGKGVEKSLYGVGRFNDNIIWITDAALKENKQTLRHVVAHEIGHAVFDKRHNENCPLMCAIVNKPANKKQIFKIMKSWSLIMKS